ncbi:MAG: THUMP domain-containing protein [Thermoproteota archaeon]|nr:THUMP domain-containing protein [Thermoproteota archaeon]
MLRDFNLIVTTARGNEGNGCSEIWYLLREMGDTEVEVDKTGVSGLIAAKTALNPFEAIEKFRTVLKQHPYEFRYALRIIPIEKVVRTDLNEIQRVATKLAEKIKAGESFRVTVEKRFTEMSSRAIVEAAAAGIKRRVDLENPDKIVLIEVVGGLTGISVIKPDEILSLIKEKMQLS